jgi:hypothetical protein
MILLTEKMQGVCSASFQYYFIAPGNSIYHKTPLVLGRKLLSGSRFTPYGWLWQWLKGWLPFYDVCCRHGIQY